MKVVVVVVCQFSFRAQHNNSHTVTVSSNIVCTTYLTMFSCIHDGGRTDVFT